MQATKRYIVRDREAGNPIDEFATLEEAETTVEEFEAEDEKDGVFELNFYEIWDTVTDEEAA